MNTPNRLIIHTTQIKDEGLEVKGELPASVLDLGDGETDRQSCPNPLMYDLTARLVSQGLLVQGQASTVARCRCDRCLRFYDLELRADDICHFEEDISEGMVDLTDELREDLLILLPTRNLCEEECQGICPKCGCNLNARECECPPAEGEDDVWHQLDDLNI